MENVDSETKSLEKPYQVKIGLYLLFAHLTILCLFQINTSFELIRFGATSRAYLGFISLAISLSILIFLIAHISKGKNWARITILILAIFVTLRGLYRIGTAASPTLMPDPLLGLLLVGLLSYITGAIFLFLPSSNSWFRARSQARKSTANH